MGSGGGAGPAGRGRLHGLLQSAGAGSDLDRSSLPIRWSRSPWGC